MNAINHDKKQGSDHMLAYSGIWTIAGTIHAILIRIEFYQIIKAAIYFRIDRIITLIVIQLFHPAFLIVFFPPLVNLES
ncbi:MAG: hypothetical protein V2B15_14510 [Bacteroidota bacterium]